MKIHYSNQLENIPMPDINFQNLYFIEISINDTPLSMLFDTGASMTVLCKSIADRLGVKKLEGKKRGGNSAGQVMEIETAVLTEMRIGNSIINDIPIIVVPDSSFDFGMDSKGSNFTAYGLLGWDIISQFYWEVDSNSRQFRLDKGGKLSGYRNLTWDAFAIVKAAYNNIEVSLGFDSGHTESMLDNTWINNLANLRKTTDNIVGVGGSTEESVVVADKVNLTIGEATMELNDVIVLEHAIYGSDPEKMSGLLGADIIQGRKWIIDYMSHCFIIV